VFGIRFELVVNANYTELAPTTIFLCSLDVKEPFAGVKVVTKMQMIEFQLMRYWIISLSFDIISFNKKSVFNEEVEWQMGSQRLVYSYYCTWRLYSYISI